ncbi:ABC transporter [archaeon SCG-AAA382B04]|nr:ABC transporter [archaeon SCG-AAA382B04]
MEVIKTKNLDKFYGDIKGVKDLDLSIRSEEIFGFLGPNGAGKTTTIRTILGFLKSTKGSVELLGKDVSNRKELVKAKEEIGFLPGEYSFYENITGREALDYFEKLKGGEKRDELIKTFSIPLDEKIKNYSHGNKQKLGIIQAFMHNPKLVVLDEPTQGLDPLMQKKFNQMILEENKKGTAIFFSSHILSEVRKVCDRVGIIKNGELITIEDIDDLMQKSGKIAIVETKEDVDRQQLDLEGINLLSQNPLKLVITDGFNELINILSKYTIEDITIRESNLEDVFMHFYEE